MKTLAFLFSFCLVLCFNSVKGGDLCLGFYNSWGYWQSGYWCEANENIYCCGSCYARYCCSNKEYQFNQGNCDNYVWRPDEMDWGWWVVISLGIVLFVATVVLVPLLVIRRRKQRKLKAYSNNHQMKSIAVNPPTYPTNNMAFPTPGPGQTVPTVFSVPPSSVVQTTIYPGQSGMSVSYAAQCPDYNSATNAEQETVKKGLNQP